MSELSAAFKGMNDAFNTEYVDNKSMIVPKDDPIVPVPKNETMPGNVELKDIDYMANQMKNLVKSTKSVMDKLDQEIIIGSKGVMFEAYGQLANSVATQLTEYRKLQESAARIQLDQNKKQNNSSLGANSKIELTADQLLDMVIGASKKSEINKIKADFTIEDEVILDDQDDSIKSDEDEEDE